MKIAVIFPSRGLVFSQTADELLRNLEGYDYDIFFSHGLPIPDCFEKPLTEALKDNYTHIWFVEDDMILPDEILSDMLLADVPVATLDYPVSKDGQGAVFKSKEGQIIFTGTGCLLVKREVFNKLKPPYFRTDVRWNPTNYDKYLKLTAMKSTRNDSYGLHDVNFGMKLYQAGIPISEIGKTGQRKLIALGKPGTNEGAHEIEEWTEVKPDYLYKKYRKFPKQENGILVEVMTKEGGLMVHPDKARKLIKAGVAQKIPQKSVVIDFNEIEL